MLKEIEIERIALVVHEANGKKYLCLFSVDGKALPLAISEEDASSIFLLADQEAEGSLPQAFKEIKSFYVTQIEADGTAVGEITTQEGVESIDVKEGVVLAKLNNAPIKLAPHIVEFTIDENLMDIK